MPTNPTPFRAARLRLGLTQVQLAERLGLTVQSVKRKEAGRQVIEARDLLALEALEARIGAPDGPTPRKRANARLGQRRRQGGPPG